MTDAELLEAFTARQDESAFGALVGRHGAMVHRACLRLLKDHHEAEDASQAVFLVLAQKAGGLRKDDLAAWLYRVAHHVAAKAVRTRMRRTGRETSYAAEEATLQVDESTPDEVAHAAVLASVDAALLSLPEHYRQAVILRYLQNHSQEDAARLARCPLGTMKRRASQGVAKLRQRLARRGVALSGTALVGLLAAEASAAVPETLLPSILATVKSALATTATATGLASVALGAKEAATSTAAMLAKGAMQAMFIAKVKKVVVAVVIGVGIVGIGVPMAMSAQRQKAVATPQNAPKVKSSAKSALDIVIPEVDFRQASYSDVLMFLVHASAQNDPENKGIRISVSDTNMAPDKLLNALVTLKAKQITVRKALWLAAEQAGFDMQITSNVVWLTERKKELRK